MKNLHIQYFKNILYISIILLVIAVLPLIYVNLRYLKYDSIRINLTGRQRMQTQKIMKEILLLQAGKNNNDSIVDSAHLVSVTIKGIIEGGNVPENSKMNSFRSLPPVVDPEIKKRLMNVTLKWSDFSSHLERYMNDREHKSLAFLINHELDLMSSIDEAVFVMQEAAERRNLRVRIIVYTTIAVILLIVSINLVLAIRDLRKAREKIEELERFVPMCSSCKRIRIDDEHPADPGSWISLEQYLNERDDKKVTHGLCPECAEKLSPGFIKRHMNS